MRACDRCGRTTLLDIPFTQVYSFSGPQQWCPHCAERRRLRRARTWAGVLAVAVVAASMLLALDTGNQVAWFVLAYAGFMVVTWLSVLPHEFGHALAARAVGYRPLAILWGSTRTFFDRRVFGVRMLIGQAPRDGVTFFEPTDDRRPRLKDAVITAAGPATNLVIAGLAIVILESFTVRGDGLLRGSLIIIAGANLFQGLGNLWPAATITVAGSVPNDGQRLWNLLRSEGLDLTERRVGALQVRLYFAYLDEAYAEVMRVADEAEKLVGPALWIDVARSAALCSRNEPARAREALLRGLQAPTPDPVSMVLAQNNLAWADFLLDDPKSDGERIERSARAMEGISWLPPVIITRACVLAAGAEPGSARVAEARRLLEGLREFHLDSKARLFAPIAHGLVAAAEGNVSQARRELEQARAVGDPGLAGAVLEARIPSR